VQAAELKFHTKLAAMTGTVIGAGYLLWSPAHIGSFIITPPLALGAAAAAVILLIITMHRDWRAFGDSIAARLTQVTETGSTEGRPIGNPVLDATIQTVALCVHDLNEQVKQLQVQRKSLEIQFRLADAERRQTLTMIHGIADAVLVTNEFDELLLANPPAEQLFNFSSKEALRKPIDELLKHDKLIADIKEMRQAKSKAGRRGIEHVIEVDGQPRSFILTQSSVTDGVDSCHGLVTVLHDTTREKEVSKLKSDFVSHVSHELRTPLSSIKAYVEMLIDGEAQTEKARSEFYGIIQTEADRLGRLIDNILNISRIESGMSKIQKKSIALDGILKAVMEVAMPTAREKSITLIDQIQPMFFQVEVDRDMIYQAALNLMSNAIKYTPAKGTVTLATSVDDAQTEVTVKVIDNGAGIPADAMKNLFSKFFRVEQNKSMAKGTGLGLNLTRQLIETVHKGKMIVESEAGKGSTFGFTLPIMK
jgi:two-component system phosphate regulon sensor histidine kinase PhoR